MAVLDKSKRISNKEITVTRKLLPQQVGRRFLIAKGEIMQHYFDIKIAEQYGVVPAILLHNFEYWIALNKANKTHFHDGKYWTYNSKKALAELFPYLTARQIDYAIQKLIDEGIIVTGNYNKSTYDRTLWYAITKKGYCILQNCEMEETKLSNGEHKIVEPIPNNTTNINPNTNTVVQTLRAVVDLYNATCVSFPKVTALSADRQKHIAARLKQYGVEKIKVVFQKAEASSFLKGENNRKWKANFDWLINETNFAKVLDGNYDDKRGNGANTDNGESLKPATGQNINYDNYRRTGV